MAVPTRDLRVLYAGEPGGPYSDAAGFTPDATYAGFGGVSAALLPVQPWEPVLPTCYVCGTAVATPRGEVPVQGLVPADLVVTACGQAQVIRGIERFRYAGRFLVRTGSLHPVRFRAGCLGHGLPRRDLLLSPGSAVFLDDALIPAECLLNGGSIVVERGLAEVEYVRVVLDHHDLLLAEGAPVESSLDESRERHPGGGVEQVPPHPGARSPGRACAPRVEDGFWLEALRSRLV